jgi:hypothetical protein
VITTCYATRNRRAPFVGLIGIWPHRSGFYRMAQAGVRVLVRRSHRLARRAMRAPDRALAVGWVRRRRLDDQSAQWAGV